MKAAFTYASSLSAEEETQANPLKIEDFEPAAAAAPAPAPAPLMLADLQSDIDRVTSTFELVQLAKAAGVAITAINTCFDNEVRCVDHCRSSD